MPFPCRRPSVEKRTFTSPCIETVIAETCGRIADEELGWLFSNCFPNTLDTTVTFTPDDGTGRPDTFIITGDIDAMWLRDSTNQVWPYVPYASRCGKLRAMLRGLIHRQARCVLLDPYANAFYRTPDKTSQWQSDHTAMRPGVHERKYELDSLAAVLRLATGYFEATGDRAPFDAEFFRAVRLIVATITAEQAGTPEQMDPPYSFARTTANATDTLPGGGHGNPCRRTGMSRSPFRPSDDSCVFQYPIAANAMAAVQLGKTAAMIDALGTEAALAADARRLAHEIDRGLRTHGILPHPIHGPVFAYEVDGYGGCVFMDDAGPPSLLALPYLGYCSPTDPVYLHTRKLVLSAENPYYHAGTAAKGVGSPHIGLGWIWPLGLITQAMTAATDAEAADCLRTLRTTHAGTGFMHEAFWMDNAERFTRHWFAWANTFFGELILHLDRHRPEVLRARFA
jgi:meiotically up-regulated gene 157 (Mug157) protein